MPASLAELRERVRKDARTVGLLPYSHNLVRLSLHEIEQRFGRAEANKAVRDFHLTQQGFNEEPEDE